MKFDLYQVGVQLNEYFGFNEEASWSSVDRCPTRIYR